MEQKTLFNKWLYRRLPYFLRKRITPQQSPFIIVALLALIVLLLQTLSILVSEPQHLNKLRETEAKLKRRPLSTIVGANPNSKHRYVPDENNLFKCFTSSKLIPFEWINDDYCDCDLDGSDEPGTDACQNGKFYCSHHTRLSCYEKSC